MITRLQGFAALSFTAIGIGIALVAREFTIVEGMTFDDVSLLALLTLVDFVLILIAAANIRWAQYVYVGLFGAGLKFRVEGLFDLPADDSLFAGATVVAFALHVVAIVMLVIEVRAQREASRMEPASAR